MSAKTLGLSGSMTALATPFRNGEIDEAAFVRLCERQVMRGTTALVVCGSTGEALREAIAGGDHHAYADTRAHLRPATLDLRCAKPGWRSNSGRDSGDIV